MRLRVDAAEHAAFAAASGDRSPIHTDPAAARRRFPGEPVVHGVHVVLRAVEALPDGAPSGLRASFVRPVLPGDDLSAEAGPDGVRVVVAGAPVAVVGPSLGRAAAPGPDPALLRRPADPAPASAADLRLGDLPGRSGVVPHGDVAALSALLPGAVAQLGVDAVADLAAVSALVGMHCPGRRALLVGLDLAPSPAPRPEPGLAWWVERVVPAVHRVELGVAGTALSGRVSAHVVPDPELPDLAALRGRVVTGEFAGPSPLVVGGSRGLGAVACRLLALGGAEPLVGFGTEAGPADAVVAEIRGAGGRATAVRIDVRDVPAALAALDDIGWEGDVVLSFATPRILRRHLGGDRPELLEELREVHVRGVVDLLVALRRRRPERLLAVGYPSSVAVDDPPDDMREYARAKAEAEAALAGLAAVDPGLRVHAPRLPRVLTEQTVAFTPAPAADPAEVLLPLLRTVVGLRR